MRKDKQQLAAFIFYVEMKYLSPSALRLNNTLVIVRGHRTRYLYVQ